MSSLLTHISISDGNVKRSSLEVLSRMTELAGEHGHSSEAVILHPKASAFVDEVSRYGAEKIWLVEHSVFEEHLNKPAVEALRKVTERAAPRLLAFASTEGTKDVLGALGAATGTAVLPDVSEFDLDGDEVTARRPVMAAKILSDTRASGDTVLVSVRSGSYELGEKPAEAETEKVDFEFDKSELKMTLKEVIGSSGDTVDLSEAETIVAAGRGAKDEEGQELVNELASLLDAGIGASRALTEAGIMDPSLQIGQTGKVVSPQLYIAIGISGAIQHVAGMANSKVIVAINKDPDAPIFDIADYGIVGDLYKVLPPFIEELRKIRN